MSDPFGTEYASIYDLLYRDKDYVQECDFLEKVFKSSGPVSSVLDLGCGTGSHARILAKRGYRVTGVDRSEAMLSIARAKSSGSIEFLSGDIRDVNLGRRFDAVLVMFAVLSYQITNSEVLEALRTARLHVDEGGLLVFDVWYGPSVLTQRPERRVKVIDDGEGRVVRTVTPELDVNRQVCTVNYVLERESQDGAASFEERHEMRFFFPREIELLLADSGFVSEETYSFPETDVPVGENSWSVLVVARAV